MAEAMEWQTVEHAAPTLVAFDTIGDVFTGVTYLGNRTIEIPESDGESFRQDEFQDLYSDEIFAINPGYQLRSALDKIPLGSIPRIEYKKNVDTGQPSPMRSFQVDIWPGDVASYLARFPNAPER